MMGRRSVTLRLLFRLLGQQDGLDVGKDAALGDGDAGEELVQFLVVPYGQLEVARYDPGLFVVPGGVTGQLEDFGGEIFHDGGQVNRGAGTDPLGVVALPQETVDTADGELEARPAGPGLRLSLHLTALASSGHDFDRFLSSILLLTIVTSLAAAGD